MPAKTRDADGHHNVYVVYLRNPKGDGKAGYYVGMTGLLPEERFWNHKNGEKAARVMGFRPAYTTREALSDFASALRLRDAKLLHETAAITRP